MRQNAVGDASEPSTAMAYRRMKFNDRTILALKPTGNDSLNPEIADQGIAVTDGDAF